MKFEVSHKTVYRYSSPVVQSQHLVHMTPRVIQHQTLLDHRLAVMPEPIAREDRTDAFGNAVVMLDIERPHRELVLHAQSLIERRLPPQVEIGASVPWDGIDGALAAKGVRMDLDVVQFRCGSRLAMPTLEIADFADVSFRPRRSVLDATMDLVLRIYETFTFDPAATDISTPITQVLRQRRGVCQDFAHLSVACLRAKRVPARYVSGYILTKPAPGQVKLQGTDASHAWISVWSPQAGWIDFDPTNGMIVGDEHIAIAYGRDYDDVSPISGVLIGGGEHTVDVGVDVTPVA